MTRTAVLVPWRPDHSWRSRAWEHVHGRYRSEHPDWTIITAPGPDGAFSRAAAILDAAECSDAEVLVIADADVWCDGVADAVDQVDEHGWAIPHRLVHRLAPASTEQLLAGGAWRGLALSTDNPQDSRPYIGHETGTLVALHRDILTAAPPDRRFVGWGQEDDAWSITLRTLIGRPWRGTHDLVHLWHPPQPRDGRVIGSAAGWALYRRYRRAANNPPAMRALIEEVNAPCGTR